LLMTAPRGGGTGRLEPTRRPLPARRWRVLAASLPPPLGDVRRPASPLRRRDGVRHLRRSPTAMNNLHQTCEDKPRFTPRRAPSSPWRLPEPLRCGMNTAISSLSSVSRIWGWTRRCRAVERSPRTKWRECVTRVVGPQLSGIGRCVSEGSRPAFGSLSSRGRWVISGNRGASWIMWRSNADIRSSHVKARVSSCIPMPRPLWRSGS
jgi:hypothetical protein